MKRTLSSGNECRNVDNSKSNNLVIACTPCSLFDAEIESLIVRVT